MQLVAQLDCPHCKTSRSGFSSETIIQTRKGFFRVPLSCAYCEEIVVARVQRNRTPNTAIVNLQDRHGPLTISSTYPKTMEHEAPKGVPDKILSTFLKALDNQSRSHHDVAVMLCGKVLDLATKEMDPAWSLERRLKKLATDGKLAPQMSEWAEEIRIDRNLAAHHDEEFTENDANGIIGFTEAFLTYLYTLPEMIKQRRIDREVDPLI